MEYDPYGVTTHYLRADFNGDGQVTADDIFAFTTLHPAQLGLGSHAEAVSADFNLDGAVTGDDIFAYLDAWFGDNGKVVPAGWITGPEPLLDNPIGYCGYVFNAETTDYTVRFRHYSPRLGRWIERDPAGYVDGASLLEYSQSTTWQTDPSGLVSGKVHHGYPLFLGGDAQGVCIALDSDDLHQAAHDQINDDIEKHAKRLNMKKGRFKDIWDWRRRVWTAISQRDRKSVIMRSFKAGGVARNEIQTLAEAVCNHQNNTPGIK